VRTRRQLAAAGLAITRGIDDVPGGSGSQKGPCPLASPSTPSSLLAAPVYYTTDMVRAPLDDGGRYETVHGELLLTPALRLLHQEIVKRLVVTPRCLPRPRAGRTRAGVTGRHLVGSGHPGPARRFRCAVGSGSDHGLAIPQDAGAGCRGAESAIHSGGPLHDAPAVPGSWRAARLDRRSRCAGCRGLDAGRRVPRRGTRANQLASGGCGGNLSRWFIWRAPGTTTATPGARADHSGAPCGEVPVEEFVFVKGELGRRGMSG
jgi:hypothetical protein